MSAFAVIFERTNTPSDPRAFDRVMGRLSHRGPDGSDVLITGNLSMGHWHFWTTPEEDGERQPLETDGLPYAIVLDGRLDNRMELFARLSLEPAGEKTISDAALILRCYARWGEDCIMRFIGDYAFVIFDRLRGTLLCARDALGDRTLFYSWFGGTRLVIASEPWAVAAGNDALPELDESTASYFFALKVPEDGRTMFKGIFELLPSCAMSVSETSERIWRFWQPEPSSRPVRRSEEEYADEFRRLLKESIRCRLRSITPVGLLMSGGLDSTSIACLAQRMLTPKRLTTISYVFDELKECDERAYINSIKEQYPIYSIEIPCDDAWTFKDWPVWPKDLNFPGGNPFRWLNERGYSRARQEGLRVLLTGGGGDQLYARGVNWLADLLGEGRLRNAAQELAYFSHTGLHRFFMSGSLQRVGRRMLDAIPGGKRLHRRQAGPGWLSTLAYHDIQQENKPVYSSQQHASILGMNVARAYSSEIFYASRHQIELRHPFRDRRLVEFIIGTPAYLLYAQGMPKHILRTAMQGILPESIRTRRGNAGYSALFPRGMEREKRLIESYCQRQDAIWRKYIRAERLASNGNFSSAPGKSMRDDVISWLCVSYASWHTSISSAIK